MIDLTFHGAALTTTGSMHLLEANGLRLLLDCGLFQGHRKEAFERNRDLPLDAARIDAVLLSHAHVDHCGNLPSLVRRGFGGRIHCTPATRDLCEVLLRDTAHLQAHELEIVNRRRRSQGKRPFEMLYEQADVDRTLALFAPEPLKSQIDLGRGVSALFHTAGHILGSAIVQVDVAGVRGGRRRLLFSGDLGQAHQPIIEDPETGLGGDILLLESTYADRLHPSADDVLGRLKAFVEDIHQQRARLIVPAFSVGRTQLLLYHLSELLARRRIPPTSIFVDSPLSTRTTQIYARHRECYDAEAAARLRQGDDPLRFPGLTFVETADQSRALCEREGPMVIIAASGMCEGGRILHHLQQGVSDPRNIVLIVGFQAENTLGRRIVEHQPVLRILGEEHPLRARVHTINALSAHADRDGLLRWFDTLDPRPRRVFAIHGEAPQCAALVAAVKERGVADAVAPGPGQTFRDL
jgi:metallo-beta-lactamase family protein